VPEKPSPAKPRLSVYVSKSLMKRIRREKADTDFRIEDLINARLRLSYEVQPVMKSEQIEAVVNA
jgi:hypothetical protein